MGCWRGGWGDLSPHFILARDCLDVVCQEQLTRINEGKEKSEFTTPHATTTTFPLNAIRTMTTTRPPSPSPSPASLPSLQNHNTDPLTTQHPPANDPIPAQVLTCGSCDKILGDSTSFVCAIRSIGGITLDHLVNVHLGNRVAETEDGAFDQFCLYRPIHCSKCTLNVGKFYISTPPPSNSPPSNHPSHSHDPPPQPNLDIIRNRYTISRTLVRFYTLGSRTQELPLAQSEEILRQLHPEPDEVVLNLGRVMSLLVYLKEEQDGILKELGRLGGRVGECGEGEAILNGDDGDADGSGTPSNGEHWRDKIQHLESEIDGLKATIRGILSHVPAASPSAGGSPGLPVFRPRSRSPPQTLVDCLREKDYPDDRIAKKRKLDPSKPLPAQPPPATTHSKPSSQNLPKPKPTPEFGTKETGVASRATGVAEVMDSDTSAASDDDGKGAKEEVGALANAPSSSSSSSPPPPSGDEHEDHTHHPNQTNKPKPTPTPAPPQTRMEKQTHDQPPLTHTQRNTQENSKGKAKTAADGTGGFGSLGIGGGKEGVRRRPVRGSTGVGGTGGAAAMGGGGAATGGRRRVSGRGV